MGRLKRTALRVLTSSLMLMVMASSDFTVMSFWFKSGGPEYPQDLL